MRALIIGAVLVLVFAATLMSCGGGAGCGGSFDVFGNFIPGVCPGPGASRGYSLQSIAVLAGPPPSPTPTPKPTTGPTVTATPTPSALATTTAVPVPSPAGSGPLPFHAVGTFVAPTGNKTVTSDITNSSDALWTSSNADALQPPPNGRGGIYNPIAPGCACVNVSAGGISGNPVGVTVFSSPPTPSCGECQTPLATPTATPHASIRDSMTAAARPSGRVQGVLQWSFDSLMPVRSNLAADPQGRLYFLTLDGVLHALGPHGRQRWRRQSAGLSLAVGNNGTVFALDKDQTLIALAPDGKPRWTSATRSSSGPLAASLDEVYLQAGNQLTSIIAPGTVHWQVPVDGDVVAAAVTPDGTLIAGVNGGLVIAIGSEGRRRWTFAPDHGFAGAIATRGESVFVGSQSGTVYSLDAASGAVRWHFGTSASVIAGPAANSTGPIFFESDALYGVASDGEVAWSRSVPGSPRDSIAVDGGGVFAAAGDAASLFNSDGTYKWNTRSFGPVTTSTVAPNGTLYVAARSGRIYAVK